MKNIILDMNAGPEDAAALFAAANASQLKLEAVCTVWGDRKIEEASENALKLLALAKAEVPVYEGCSTAVTKYLARNRIAKMQPAQQIQPVPASLPQTDRTVEQLPAACFYIDYLRKADTAITIVTLGPLTNLGLALRIAPDIAGKIQEVIVAGGGKSLVDWTGCAEKNIWYDPEAAQILLSSGAKVTFISLDAAACVYLTAEECRVLQNSSGPAGMAAAGLTGTQDAVICAQQHPDWQIIAANRAALAVCAAADRSVLGDLKPTHCEIGLMGYGEGQTVLDGRYKADEANACFARNADRGIYAEKLCSMLARKAPED